MKRVFDFLKRAGTYYIATVEDGLPHVRPFGTINIFDGALYIQTGRRKACYRQLIANPSIELCAMNGGNWLRLSAKAIEDRRLEAEESLLQAYPELSDMYKPGDGNNAVFRLEGCRATISSFTSTPIVIEF